MDKNENIPALLSVDSIVKGYLAKRGEFSDKNMRRFRIIANDYVSRELNQFSFPSVEVAYLDFSSSHVRRLPPDFKNYITIAIMINGELWTLTRNDKLALQRGVECGEYIKDIGTGGYNPSSGYYLHDHYYGGQLRSALMTRGGGFNYAYYRIDWKERLLILDGSVPNGEVVVEYISTGVRKDGLTPVPHEAANCVEAYIDFYRTQCDDNQPEYRVRRKQRYLREREAELDFFLNPIDLDEVLDRLWSNYYKGAKF